jgi:nucleotide-binding universal stress UspA family protein
MLATVGQELSAALLAELETYVRQEKLDTRLAELASAHTDTLLAGARLEAQAKGATRISIRSSAGDPVEEIIALATEWRADLIILGRSGHGRLAGLLPRQRRAKGPGARRLSRPHRALTPK